ncbi:MAG: hypothetical protein Q4C01_05350 [Clostridia bacterium]|nr:hypothetical protein [Clostridia bacterium]
MGIHKSCYKIGPIRFCFITPFVVRDLRPWADYRIRAGSPVDITVNFVPVDDPNKPESAPIYLSDYCVFDAGDKFVRCLRNFEGQLCSWLDLPKEGNCREFTCKYLKSDERTLIYSKQLFRAIDLVKLLLDFNCLMVHAACVEYKNHALLFVGASGSGKSTQARLWGQRRSTRTINGDRVILQLGDDGSLTVHGLPFSGTSPDCINASLPLGEIVSIIFSLNNRITEMVPLETLTHLMNNSARNLYDRDFNCRFFDLVNGIANQKQALYLRCSEGYESVRTLERFIREKRSWTNL